MELKKCTPELENGVEYVVLIHTFTLVCYIHILVPICSVIIASNLFGELVVHVTGICDCQCSNKPVSMLSNCYILQFILLCVILVIDPK